MIRNTELFSYGIPSAVKEYVICLAVHMPFASEWARAARAAGRVGAGGDGGRGGRAACVAGPGRLARSTGASAPGRPGGYQWRYLHCEVAVQTGLASLWRRAEAAWMRALAHAEASGRHGGGSLGGPLHLVHRRV